RSGSRQHVKGLFIHRAVGLFDQADDLALRGVELLGAIARQPHALFKEAERFFQVDFASLELAHDLLEPGEGLLKRQLLLLTHASDPLALSGPWPKVIPWGGSAARSHRRP